MGLREESAPAGDEILHHDTDQRRSHPVDDKSEGEEEAEHPEHDGEHEQHHPLGALLRRVCRGDLTHLLLYEHAEPGEPHEDITEDAPRAHGFEREVHAEETPADGDGGVQEGQPAVELAGEAREVLRGEGQHAVDGPEEPDEDGHLYDERAETAHGVHAHLFVQFHDLLATKLRIALVLLVDFLDTRLKALQTPRLAQLPHDEWVGEAANDDGEGDDRHAKVRAQEYVQQEKAVRHRFGDDF